MGGGNAAHVSQLRGAGALNDKVFNTRKRGSVDIAKAFEGAQGSRRPSMLDRENAARDLPVTPRDCSLGGRKVGLYSPRSRGEQKSEEFSAPTKGMIRQPCARDSGDIMGWNAKAPEVGVRKGATAAKGTTLYKWCIFKFTSKIIFIIILTKKNYIYNHSNL